MKRIFATTLALCMVAVSLAIPKYDEGAIQLKGIQLLQDHADPNAYYYMPRYPRMAIRTDGTYEFLFMKYVGKGAAANGGIFHALVEFTMPGDEIDKLQDTLKIVLKNNSARIVGPVPLQQVSKDGENGLASFQVVSSILSNTSGGNPFTQTIITSGHAPFLPGSKAAIAARLTQEGATLLWESMQSRTSDVSVMINGYYEAYVKAYAATITAEVNSIYQHYSRISSYQEGFTKDQARKITDELVQNQIIKIESFDRSAALGIKSDEMKALLDLITDKLMELMFDSKTGWMQTPEREAAVEPDQIKGRQEAGWLSQLFSGGSNQPYFSDNQYVLKRRTDIRTNTFYLNLSQATTIKVPVYTSGNLSGVYDAMKKGNVSYGEYFRVVNMDDSAFQKRNISFMMDGGFAESFNDIFNLVTVSFRKLYGNGSGDVNDEILFTRKNFETGASILQNVSYPRLGSNNEDFQQYEYRVSWNLKGNNKLLRFPSNESEWTKASEGGITLMPPLKKRKITVEADRSLLTDSAGSSTIVIKFLTVLGGEATVQKTLLIRTKDATNIHDLALFHDPNEPVAYQVTLHTPTGEKRGKLKELKDDFLMINRSELQQ